MIHCKLTYKQGLLWAMLLAVLTGTWAQSGAYPYKKPKYTTSQTKKPTYNIGGTNYIYGETYVTTGKPKVERNYEARKKFLKSKGYSRAPRGYEVDHIIPLSQGGRDDPSNMQLLSKEAHRRKTAREREQVRAANYKKKRYSSSAPYRSSYKTTGYRYRSSSTYKSSSYRPRKNYSSRSASSSYTYKPRSSSRAYKSSSRSYGSRLYYGSRRRSY
jgi:hypothetical protein